MVYYVARPPYKFPVYELLYTEYTNNGVMMTF